jgi:uncharacterized protein (TIGR00645 family)
LGTLTVVSGAPRSGDRDGRRPGDAPKRWLHDSLPYVLIEKIVFDLRYALVLAYLGVGALVVVFAARSAWMSLELIPKVWHSTAEQNTIGILSGLDAIMVANVAYLIIAGSYLVYVKDPLHDRVFETREMRPQALRRLSPGNLKEKMAASLVGVSSVNLIQVLINAGTAHGGVNWHVVGIKLAIHGALLIGVLVFSFANRAEDVAEVVTAVERSLAEEARPAGATEGS